MLIKRSKIPKSNHSKNISSKGLSSTAKIVGGTASGGGLLYAAGELSKNTDRLNPDYGHVGGVFGIGENTAMVSSVPLSHLGSGTFPMLEDAKKLGNERRRVKRIVKG